MDRVTEPGRACGAGYVGRFAPSPSGPLHFGSLVAAVGSYLEARTHRGLWLLRIEDIDAPRTAPGAADTIIRQLADFGFAWDGPIVYQSQRLSRYHSALESLQARSEAFACACTRRELADSALAPDGSRRYPGTCRAGLPPGRAARAWRLKTEPGSIHWHDGVQGDQQQDVWAEVGDFVLLRADGQFAYQLAVVVDDGAQGVTHVVRGADLLGSTARQIQLIAKLGLPALHYTHLPVATNAGGEKLSKQTLARSLDEGTPVALLGQALTFLGHPPPAELCRSSLGELWQWALAHWQLARVPRTQGQVWPDDLA